MFRSEQTSTPAAAADFGCEFPSTSSSFHIMCLLFCVFSTVFRYCSHQISILPAQTLPAQTLRPSNLGDIGGPGLNHFSTKPARWAVQVASGTSVDLRLMFTTASTHQAPSIGGTPAHRDFGAPIASRHERSDRTLRSGGSWPYYYRSDRFARSLGAWFAKKRHKTVRTPRILHSFQCRPLEAVRFRRGRFGPGPPPRRGAACTSTRLESVWRCIECCEWGWRRRCCIE